MDDTEKLGQMLDALINSNPEEARIAFHGYLGAKVKEEIRDVANNTSDNTEE